MRWATFHGTDAITVHGGEWGRTFLPGGRVDLNEPLPGGATWAEMLGPYVSLFVMDADAAPSADVQEDPDGV